MTTTRYRSSSWPMAAIWLALIVYASWHPFDWKLPQLSAQLLLLPWPRYWDRFDVVANLFGYWPFGALMAWGVLRAGRRTLHAAWLPMAVAALVSYVMEVGQHALPQRVPSAGDWVLNTCGALLGALSVMGLHWSTGGLRWWSSWRERWLLAGRGVGVTLLLLWPVALLFPPPVPLGVGQVLGRAVQAIAALLVDSPWEGLIKPPSPHATGSLAPQLEFLATAAGIALPCLLAFTLSHPGVRRLVLVAGAVALGVLATALSTALNFGPDHMGAWLTQPVVPALAAGALAAAALCAVSERGAALIGLVVGTVLVTVVNLAPADPYFTASLQAWEQGRFIRFHGVAGWVGWLWPWVTLAYLLARVMKPRD